MEVSSDPGFYTHQSFLGILYRFFFLGKKTKRKIFTFWLGFAGKMTSQSNNVGVPESSQVATPIVAQVATPIVIFQAPMVHTSGLVFVSPGEKPKKFNGPNFKRYQQKMIFYLTTLNLARFLTEDASQLKEHEHDIQVISAIEAWKHSDFLCDTQT